MSFLTTQILCDQLADAGSIPNGYLLAFNATTKRFEPVAPASGGSSGHSITDSGNLGGSVLFDANGRPIVTAPSTTGASGFPQGFVLNSRLDSFRGRNTASSPNGLWIPLLAASVVYTGSDILNRLIWNPEQTLDVIWYKVELYGVVISPAAQGTLRADVQYRDRVQLQTVNVFTDFNITAAGNQPYHDAANFTDVCVPIQDHHVGIFLDIVGTGIGGTGINVTFDYLVSGLGI